MSAVSMKFSIECGIEHTIRVLFVDAATEQVRSQSDGRDVERPNLARRHRDFPIVATSAVTILGAGQFADRVAAGDPRPTRHCPL